MLKLKSLEWSLPVPSVQDLVRLSPNAVPERYMIRDDGDDDVPGGGHVIPLIDLSKLLSGDEEEVEKLHAACTDWGIFQLVKHGLSEESCLGKMRKSAEEFFAMGLGEKEESCGQEGGSLEGYGQAFVGSDEQKLEWSDMLFVKALPVENRNPRLWAGMAEELRESLDHYSRSVRDLAACLVKVMMKKLLLSGGSNKESESESEMMMSLKDEGVCEVRINCCPPCAAPDRVLGISPHADISLITLLLDCGDQPALQVLKDNQWVFIQPLQDAFVVNLGQIMQVVSNGIYKAPEHRVRVNRGKERLSVVTFCYPRWSAVIGPAQELVGPDSPPIYRNLSLQHYFHSFFNRILDDPFINTLQL